MSCNKTGISRPIDAFVKYFLDVKPYHTKILEVIERYVFRDSLEVGFSESLHTEIGLANAALCRPVGFGLEWDEPCGLDPPSCCDLFTCTGYPFGITEGTPLTTAPIVATIAEEGAVFVLGDLRFDTFLNIISIPSVNKAVVSGDKRSLFTDQEMFMIVPENIYPIVSTTATAIQISGNRVAQFINKQEFILFGSGSNDGRYSTSTASYNAATDTTTVTLATNVVLDNSETGSVRVASGTKNNGPYLVSSVTFDGTNTIITTNSGKTPILLTNTTESAHGAIRLRTGFLPQRILQISGSGVNDGNHTLTTVSYDKETDRTKLVFASNLGTDEFTGSVVLAASNAEVCSPTKATNISASFSERLTIEIIPVMVE